jgi:hypothetical protein
MVAMEVLFLIEAHSVQGRTHRPFARGEDRARQQYLGVAPDSFGEKWREGGQNPYHRGR